MTGWPRVRSIQRLNKDDMKKKKVEEVRDDNSVGSKVSQVLTEVASSLGFDSVPSSTATMPAQEKSSSSRWDRFTGMLERRMSRLPQDNTGLINVELRVSQSQSQAPVPNTSISTRSSSPATVGSLKSAPHSAIRNTSDVSRCPSPATVASRKSVTFDPESYSSTGSQASKKSVTFEISENLVDRRDDSSEKGRTKQLKEPAQGLPPVVEHKEIQGAVEHKEIQGASYESDIGDEFDRYKPALSYDETSLLPDHQQRTKSQTDRRLKQALSHSPKTLPSLSKGSKSHEGTGSNSTLPKKKSEAKYELVAPTPAQQKPDIINDDVSTISEITGTSMSFAPSPYPRHSVGTTEKRSRQHSQPSRTNRRKQQKQKQTSQKAMETTLPISAQGAARKLDPILRNKNKKYPPSSAPAPSLRRVVTPPALDRDSHRNDDAVAEDSRKRQTVNHDDSRDNKGSDYLSFSDLLIRMTACSGRQSEFDDLLHSPSHSLDDEDQDDDDDDREVDDEDRDSYFAVSTVKTSFDESNRSGSISTIAHAQDIFSMILCGSGNNQRLGTSTNRP